MDSARVAAISFFADLPESELAAIARFAAEVDIDNGRPIATQGDFGHSIFVIEQGTANVVEDGATVRALGPGDVVGEVAVLKSGRRTASVVATSPIRALVLFKREVWALEREAPETARRLRSVLRKGSDVPAAR